MKGKIMQKLFAASMTMMMATLAPSPLIASAAAGQQDAIPVALPEPAEQAAPDTEFTPLDAIDRVRKEGCGIDQFEQFLGWYTSATAGGGWLEQVVWTNYLVKVGSLANPAGPGRWIDRQDYLGQFRIDSFDYRSIRRPTTLVPDRDFRQVTFHRLEEKRYRVDWHGGSGFAGVEGADQDKQDGAYIFEYKKDCWYLTEDLR